MAKVIFTFFEADVQEDDVIPFIKKMEEVMKKFAGEAYHFRYCLEERPDTAELRTQKNGSKNHHASKRHRFQ